MFNPLKKKKPNVIMIMIDGLRYDALGKVDYYNELKKESMFFSNLITYAPYTIGSLHTLFSGMDGNCNGVNGYYKSASFDKDNCFTLAQYLKNNGYYTEADVIYEAIIPNKGFDKIRPHNEFKDDLVKRHSEVIQQIKDKGPFFLFLDYRNIHTNLVNDVIKKHSDFDEDYFKNKEDNFRDYIGWAEKSADYLKTIIEKIKNTGLWEDSIIIVFTDHGTSIGDRIGEKAYGIYLYEYTLRCFLYILGKGFPKGLEVKSLVRSIDFLPTMLDILKLKEKKNYKIIWGKSFLPFIFGKKEERIAYSETGGLGGPTPSPEIHNVQAVRTNRWKLIYNKTNKKKELYDLEADSKENINLAGKGQEIETELWKEMQKH